MLQDQEIQALKVSEHSVDVNAPEPQTDGSKLPHDSGKP